MISLLRATWTESFSFFVSSDSRLYPLLILNTLFRTSKIILLYFFWLIPLAWFSYVSLRQDLLELSPTSQSFSFVSFSGQLVEALLFFTIILSTRTSLEPKSFSYFMYYSPRIIAFGFLWILPYLMWIVPQVLALPFICIVAFFFLDGPFSIKNFAYAFLNGIKMIIYFLPLFLAAIIASVLCINALKLPYTIITIYMPHLPIPALTIDFIFTFLNSMLLTSTLSVLYITLKHRHYKLFFAE